MRNGRLAVAAALLLSSGLAVSTVETAQAGPTPQAAVQPVAKARAAVAGSYTIATTGKLLVTIRSNSSKVKLSYRNAKGKVKAKKVRVRKGVAAVRLPAGATRVRAKALATKRLKASRYLTLRVAGSPGASTSTPPPTTPVPPKQPAPTVTSPPGKPFTIAVVPDTQMETAGHPKSFTGRIQWLIANRPALNLALVAQVGDLVDTDNCGESSVVFLDVARTRAQCNQAMRDRNVFYPIPTKPDHYQYDNANNGLALLDQAGIPYSLAIGNHDGAAVCGGPACIGANPDWAVPGTKTTRELLRSTGTWDSYFPASRFRGAQAYGTFEGHSGNMYQTLSAGNMRWLVINLELWPRAEAVAWARQVVAAHPQHNVIVNTHHYLSPDGSLSPVHGGYGDTSPQYLFDNLIKLYPNIRIVLSGHNNGSVHRLDVGVHGNPIHSFLTAFHDPTSAQTRLLTIDPAGDSLSSVLYVNPALSQQTLPEGAGSYAGMSWIRS